MARYKVGTRDQRATTVVQMQVMRKALKRAVQLAKSGDCVGALIRLDNAYKRAQYPAAQRTRDLAKSAYDRSSRTVYRICRM